MGSPTAALVEKVAKLSSVGGWSGVGQTIGTWLAAVAQVQNPLLWGAAAASCFGIAAALGVLPGPERKPRADLRRCLDHLGRMYYESVLREDEYEAARRLCIEAHERAMHGGK